MNNVFYPSKNDNKKIYIAVLSKPLDINAQGYNFRVQG